MLAFQKGDKASFETLMKRYYPRVLNFIYRFTGSRETSEELTQDVFIRIHKSALLYRPQARFQTWLFQIAKNASLNELRKNKKNVVSLDKNFDTEENSLKRQIADAHSPSPDQDVLDQETQDLIETAMRSLPENQRMAVILRRYEDFSYEEIAHTMQCSVQAVKSLLSRAREKLKEQLSGHFKAT